MIINFLANLRYNELFLQYMINIDKINAEILLSLEKNGRISNTDRVQDLERSGIIKGYRAVIDRKQLGASVTIFVMVGLSAHLKKDAQAFERAMLTAPEVRECHNITGNVEYLLRVEVADLEAYKDFHANTLGTLAQVSSITSYITLGSSKDMRA